LPEENKIDEDKPAVQAPKRGRGRPPGPLKKEKIMECFNIFIEIKILYKYIIIEIKIL
jgi:hypothetical protein